MRSTRNVDWPERDGALRRLGAVVAVAVMVVAATATTGCNEKHGCCYDVVCPMPFPLQAIVDPASDTIRSGEAASFRGVVIGYAGDPCDEGTKSRQSQAVKWRVVDEAVAVITSATDSTVAVQGKSAGSTTVVATSVADPAVQAAGLLVVRP